MTASRDGEKGFDGVLARGLRQTLDESASGCPDAGVLAAYYDRQLTTAETDVCERHFSACARCQADLLAIARTDVTERRATAPRWHLPAWMTGFGWMGPAAAAATAVIALSVALRVAPTALQLASRPAGAPSRNPLEVPAPVPRESGATATLDDRSNEPRSDRAPQAAGSAPEPSGSASAPARPELLGAMKQREAVARMEQAAPVEWAVIRSPDGRVAWRIGARGSIERSTDGGRSWERQKSGVQADLKSGAAVSPTLCWVVGREGTVLRTLDGKRWEKVSEPTGEDLVDARPQDADAAAVVSATGHRFVTSDGGRTWRAE